MKHLLTLLTVLICLSETTFAQAPQSIPYQAVARDNSGNLISNQSVSLRFTIHDATAVGSIVYLMDQGLPTDSQRQRFFDELRVRNIGQLYEIRRALEDKDYLQVITDLLTIQPENVIETNYKTIYGKMESVLRYDSSLTPDDSLEIKEIASQLACEGGPAVYMARAILDEEYDDELTASLYKIRAATSTMEEVIIFPNPTSGVVTISKDLSGYSGCSFDVFDFHGKHCNSSVLDVTINPIQKDLSTLKNGIYFLRIHCDGIVINTMKLIIIK